MSAGYGYITIFFADAEGNKDSEMTRKAFEYSRNHFDFFNSDEDDWEDYGDYFLCLENFGLIVTAKEGDGLDIKRTSPEAVEAGWIQEIYSELKPYQMKVRFIRDFSESSFESMSATFYEVRGKDGVRSLAKCKDFSFTCGMRYDIDDNVMVDGGYTLVNESCDPYYIMAENRKTGRVVPLCSEVELEEGEENEYGVPELMHVNLLDAYGNQVRLNDEDSAVHAFNPEWTVRDLIENEYLDLEEGESDRDDEWMYFIRVPDFARFIPEALDTWQKIPSSKPDSLKGLDEFLGDL